VNEQTPEHRLASVPAVKQYLRAAQACGLNYQAYLEQANISQEVLNNNNQWVPAEALEQLLTLLIANCGDPCFGLHTSRHVSYDIYSVLGYINMNCATMREVWDQTPTYEKIVGDMGVSMAVYGQTESCLRWRCNYTDPEVRRHITENIIASWHCYARQHLFPEHNDSGPLRVCFTHSAPADPQLLEDYEKIFACEVLFDQEYNCIWIDNSLLDLPIEQANPELLNSLLDHAAKLLLERDKNCSLAEKVKNLLRLMLSNELPRREAVAEQLHMNSRTLQRRLVEEGTSYQNLLNELRIELACHYLVKTDFTLEAIAEKLGFTETRSFYRYFKNWAGITAGEYRKSHQS